MKKAILFLLVVAMIVPMLSIGTVSQAQAGSRDMRGVWVATVFSIDFPSSKNNVVAQRAELDKIVETAAAAGLNSIFFQVIPQGDALYKSAIYPWAASLTGVAGKDPGYDPLAYIIESAKKKGIAVHAWVNPYRLTLGNAAKPQHNVNDLPEGHPVRKNPSLAVAFDDGRLYLNPGEPEAQKIVLDCVRELVTNYDIAGVHFDDYFYPDPNVTKDGQKYKATFNDDATFAKYGNGLSLADWRRSNTYSLIKQTQALVKSLDPKTAFGVSPSGVWENKKSNPLGSDTNSFSSYSAIYADTRKWVKDGILDYICPQIYWKIGATNSDYKTLINWWSQVCSGTNVKLYIGHAAHRVGEWQSSDEIISQLKMNEGVSNISGSMFYGFEEISQNLLSISTKLSGYYNGGTTSKPEFTPSESLAPVVTGLQIGAPTNNVRTANSKTYIIGAGVNGVPIFVNGKEINRTPTGYFALFVDLNWGVNKFEFKHNGETVNYTINRAEASSGGGSGGASSSRATPFALDGVSAGTAVGTIKVDDAVMRESNSESSSRLTPLNKGFTDYIVKETGSYYKFRYGGWTLKTNVSTSTKKLAQNNITYINGIRMADDTTISWRMPYGAMYTITEKVEGIEIRFHDVKGRSAFSMAAANPLFKSISFRQDGDDAVYTLLTKKDRYLFGYDITYKNGMVAMKFQHPLTLSAGNRPLAGKVIHLDSGHGGADSGATGPLGSKGPREADLNMYAALRLEERLKALGATVIMPNRDVKATTSQGARERSVRASKADIGISIHHNSVDTSVNVGQVSGTETLYSQPLSRRLADTIQKNFISATGAKDRGVKYQSLFMCRYNELPTVLVELGFITNPYDYEKLTDKAYIEREVDGIVNGVLEYMRY